MPIATPEQYAAMLDTAKRDSFAFPAVNVSSTQTLNAALQGFAEAGSDGIIQVTTGGSDYLAGHTVKNRAGGALAFVAFAEEVAKSYGVTIALHTDHCPKNALDDFLLPLLAASEERVRAGGLPYFQSHMWDGSAVPLEENLKIAQEILPRMKAINSVLEVEIGVVGGEEDGVSHEINDQLYTTLDDAIATVEAMGLGEQGRYMTALTFGNVHGVYKPGNVKLRPSLLGEIQAGIAEKYGTAAKPLDLVFHGGSGSTAEEISEAVANGVIKMNIDTDTQYAFTRSIADSMFKNYDSVLKVDGEVGNKKQYDPRAWGKVAESAMAARIVEAAEQLGSAGKSVSA
ncbi:MAG: class II fructose-bisphosphate aldolase [Leucobacter sp.]